VGTLAAFETLISHSSRGEAAANMAGHFQAQGIYSKSEGDQGHERNHAILFTTL
jgi:hypothetical protein